MYVRSHSFPFLPGKVHDFSLTRSRKKKKKVLLLPFTQAMANAFLKQLNATLLLQVSFIAIYHSLAAQLSCFLGPTMTSLCRVSFFYYFFLSISVTPTPPQWWRRGFRQGLILQAVFGKKSGKEEGSGEQAQSCGAVHPSNIKGSILQADGLGE